MHYCVQAFALAVWARAHCSMSMWAIFADDASWVFASVEAKVRVVLGKESIGI